MNELISDLLSYSKEGLYWDFKQEMHKNSLDLIHDITCMANLNHDGDRYIIFGISDTCEVVGVMMMNRTQADIIDLLRKQPYAENTPPNISFTKTIYCEKELYVLTIKNDRNKPFYFTKEIRKDNKRLHAGAIYSRQGDANTPKDSTENPLEVVKMWKEKLGLNLKPIDKFLEILLNTNDWETDGISTYHYINDPAYQICLLSEIQDHTSFNQFWWGRKLYEQPYKNVYELKYNGVTLKKIVTLFFKNDRLEVPFPSINYLTYPDKGDGRKSKLHCDFYYYQKGTVEYSFLVFLRRWYFPDDTLEIFPPFKSQHKPPIISLPFFIVEDEEHFISLAIEYLSQYDKFIEIEPLLDKQNSTLISQDEKLELEKKLSEIAFKNIMVLCN